MSSLYILLSINKTLLPSELVPTFSPTKNDYLVPVLSGFLDHRCILSPNQDTVTIAESTGGLSAAQATDQGAEGIEVAFSVAGDGGKELREAAFYGSIASIRVTPGAPPD